MLVLKTKKNHYYITLLKKHSSKCVPDSMMKIFIFKALKHDKHHLLPSFNFELTNSE